MQVEDLRLLYPSLDYIYRHHFKSSKFDIMKGPDYRSLKERLVLLHLLEKQKEVCRGLIQALISELDLRRAQQIPHRSEKNAESDMPSSRSKVISILASGPRYTDEESVKKEMRKMANAVSGPAFLCELKGVFFLKLEFNVPAKRQDGTGLTTTTNLCA